MGPLRVELLAAAATGGGSAGLGAWRGGLRSDVDNGEGLEGILGGLVFESLLVSRPGSTFEVQTMDADTFRRCGEGLLNATIFTTNDFLLDLCLGLDGIKGPLLLSVLSGDLLHGGSEETLWVVEASEPEGDGAATLGEPVVQLEVPVDEAADPTGEGWREP